MKILFRNISLFSLLLLLFACNDLELSRLDTPGSGSWYSTKEQFRYSLNALYSGSFIRTDDTFWTDDIQKRTEANGYYSGSINAEWGTARGIWETVYKGIARCNTILNNIENNGTMLSEELRRQYKGETQLVKAYLYGYLISHYGDVPYFDADLTVEEAESTTRTDKTVIQGKVYEMFDDAVELLPESYNGTQYFTKGAALGLKGRIALWLNDFQVAATASKGCIDLDIYDLHSNFSNMFRTNTRTSTEFIVVFPRSEAFNKTSGKNWYMPRTFDGGYAGYSPTWQLLASFNSRDGLPIDESPLFDSHNPFMDRDPRLWATIIPFGKLTASDDLTERSGYPFFGITYNPHPEVLYHINGSGDTIVNKDTKATQTYASFNGLLVSKGFDYDWLDDRKTDANHIAMRYAEVLLTYAEAKIELNQIDNSVLEALNSVRERGYADSGFDYPEITTTDQAQLRKVVRSERRAELALEGLRFMDLIRWRIAEKALANKSYGLYLMNPVKYNQEPNGELLDKVVTPGHWFWGETPQIDEDGIADFAPLEAKNMCRVLYSRKWKADRQYLFPIPDSDRLLDVELTQNPNY